MYSFSASSERRMRVSLTRVTPLTATVEAGAESETTSAAAEVFTGALFSGAEVTGVEVAAVVASGAELGEGVFSTGGSFLATVAGSGLLGRMLFTGTPAEGLDFEVVLAATVSTLGSGFGLKVTG